MPPLPQQAIFIASSGIVTGRYEEGRELAPTNTPTLIADTPPLFSLRYATADYFI